MRLEISSLHLRRKARREMYGASSEKDSEQVGISMENENPDDTKLPELIMDESHEEQHVENRNSEESKKTEGENGDGDLSVILNQIRLEEDSSKAYHDHEGQNRSCEGLDSNKHGVEVSNDELEHMDIKSQTSESDDASSYVDDNSNKIFCPSCGNGETPHKLAVTVGENGMVVAARRPRISLRGTKASVYISGFHFSSEDFKRKFSSFSASLGDKDIFASCDYLFIRHTDKKAPLQPPVRKAIAVFSGRRNPNDNYYSRSMH
ncbi:hypothetical protein LguiB_034692 [Lonicera macranthoides]